MKKVWFVLFLFCMGLASLPSSKAAAQPNCLNFWVYPDNTTLGSPVTLNGFTLQKLGGFTPFVNVFADAAGHSVHGVQFANAGLIVNLPAPSGIIAILIGLFAPVEATIYALNTAGGVEDTQQLPADNLLHNITLTQTTNPITRLRVVGGDNKIVINEICH